MHRGSEAGKLQGCWEKKQLSDLLQGSREEEGLSHLAGVTAEIPGPP